MTKKTKVQPKEKFEIFSKCEAFYTGGKIQFSNDGQFILTLCEDKLKSFQISNGEVMDAISNEDEDGVISYLLADDDETLITSAKSGVMRHWHMPTKTVKKTWKSLHRGSVSCMSFDSTVTLLATGGSDSTIKVYDLDRKYFTHNLKGGKGVFSKVCFQELAGNLIVFGASDDYMIHGWDLKSNDCVASLEGHFSTITDLVFYNDGKTMLSSSRDKVVLVWDLETYKLVRTIPIYESVEACILVPDELHLSNVNLNSNETYFITAGNTGILKVWSANSGRCVYQQSNSPVLLPDDSSYVGPLITQANYIPLLDAFSITTFEHNIIFYSLKDFELIKQFVGYNDDVLCLKMMGKDEDHLAVATNSSQIKIFNFPSFSCQLLRGHSDLVLSLDVFPMHKNILISGSKDNSIKAWVFDENSKYANHVYTGFGHTDSVTAVACCRGNSFIFASGSEDSTLKLWEVPEKPPLVSIKLLLTPFCTVKAHDKHINSICISENDRIIASGSQDHTAKIWDATDLSLLGTLRGHKKGVWCVNFSPVDLVVATSSGDQTIRIWSIADFSCLKVFQGHECPVLQVLFLTKGTQLLSSSADGNLKLWDIKNNLCINTFEGHDKRVWTLTNTSNEEYVISGGADSNVIVWKDVTGIENEQKMKENEECIAKEQLLKNLMHEKQWTKALGLAIALDRPYTAYTIIEELMLQENGRKVLHDVFSNLRQDQRESLMKFSREWVTNAKTCYSAVIVMDFIYRSCDFKDLLEIPDIKQHVQDSLPYLDRHFKRMNRRCQDMQILEFLCRQFKLPEHSRKDSTVDDSHSLNVELSDGKRSLEPDTGQANKKIRTEIDACT